MMNQFCGIGRLTKTPELKMTPNEVALCNFSLAIDQDFVDKETGKRQTDFLECVAWRSTAEFVSKNFVQGQMMGVVGRVITDNFTDKDGIKRKSVRIQVESACFAGSRPNGNGSAPAQEQQNGQYAPQGQQSPNGGYAPAPQGQNNQYAAQAQQAYKQGQGGQYPTNGYAVPAPQEQGNQYRQAPANWKPPF